MEILIVSLPLILLGIIYGIINLVRKKKLEAIIWGLLAFIGFLILTIAMQAVALHQKDVRIIYLKHKIEKSEDRRIETDL